MVAVLSRNEIRDRVLRFVADWRDETRERAEAQTFWNEFLDAFGVKRRQVASFEQAAKRASTGRPGSADVFWPEYLLAEHKSRTNPPQDLAKALDQQAADYLALVAGGEAAEAREPGDRPFDHPAVATEALGRLDALARDADADPTASEVGAAARDVVGFVGVELGRSKPWPPRPPARPDNGRDRLDQRLEDARVVQVGRRQADGKWDPLAVHDQVVLGAELPTIGGVPPGGLAPFLARTLVLSRLARSQSIPPSSPNQFRIVRCRRSHTPASCHSRTRRQQVIPLPYPNSVGSRFHGIPVCSTKTIPPSAARSDIHGRPPLGCAARRGNSGSIAAHNSSLTNGCCAMTSDYRQPSQGCETSS